MVFPFYKLQAICHRHWILAAEDVALETPSGNGEALEISKTPSVYPEKKTHVCHWTLPYLLDYQRDSKDLTYLLSGLAIQMGIQGCTNDINMFGGTSFHPLGFPDHRAFFRPITGLFACKTIQLDWAVRLTAGWFSELGLGLLEATRGANTPAGVQ